MNVKESEIKEILNQYKKFVVLGLSPDQTKPSQKVPMFMKSKGYEVVGVYPGEKNINGFPIYAALKDVPKEFRKFVDIFRRAEHLPQIVDEIIQVGGVEVLWIQLGITHPEAEKKAEAAGIKVISNKCLHLEYEKYMK